MSLTRVILRSDAMGQRLQQAIGKELRELTRHHENCPRSVRSWPISVTDFNLKPSPVSHGEGQEMPVLVLIIYEPVGQRRNGLTDLDARPATQSTTKSRHIAHAAKARSLHGELLGNRLQVREHLKQTSMQVSPEGRRETTSFDFGADARGEDVHTIELLRCARIFSPIGKKAAPERKTMSIADCMRKAKESRRQTVSSFGQLTQGLRCRHSEMTTSNQISCQPLLLNIHDRSCELILQRV